jgi:hypothetical protein
MTYAWSDDSALYQVRTGEPGSARTVSAFGYLERAISDPGVALDEVQSVARELLEIVQRLRASEAPADPGQETPAVQILAENLGMERNGPASDGRGWFRNDTERAELIARARELLKGTPWEDNPHMTVSHGVIRDTRYDRRETSS